jgi:hypothetical protein
MHPLHLKVMTWSLALFGVVTYVVCVLYGLIAPKGLHTTQLLEWMLPGFKWLSLGLVFTLVYNAVQRRYADAG